MTEPTELAPLCHGHWFSPGIRDFDMMTTQCAVCGRDWTDEALARSQAAGLEIVKRLNQAGFYPD